MIINAIMNLFTWEASDLSFTSLETDVHLLHLGCCAGSWAWSLTSRFSCVRSLRNESSLLLFVTLFIPDTHTYQISLTQQRHQHVEVLNKSLNNELLIKNRLLDWLYLCRMSSKVGKTKNKYVAKLFFGLTVWWRKGVDFFPF